MLKELEIDKYLLSFNDVFCENDKKDNTVLYKIKKDNDDSLFAVVYHDSNPLRISLRCDRLLAKRLRDTYETVMAGVNLSSRDWNTIICTGQLSSEQIFDLARLSYQLAVSL